MERRDFLKLSGLSLAATALQAQQTANKPNIIIALCGKNHTYLRAKDVDVWREFGHDGGYIPPDAPPFDA